MATQFVYNNVDPFEATVFLCELQDYSLDSIMSGYTLNNTDLTVNFSQDLTTQEETDLNSIVTNHPSLKWQLKMYAADYRWQRETGGILSQGYGIDTSDRSKVLINGAYNKVLKDNTPNAIMEFKTSSGWTDLLHSEVELIALDVADHVRKCFHAEKYVDDEIDLGNITSTGQVVTEFETEYASA